MSRDLFIMCYGYPMYAVMLLYIASLFPCRWLERCCVRVGKMQVYISYTKSTFSRAASLFLVHFPLFTEKQLCTHGIYISICRNLSCLFPCLVLGDFAQHARTFGSTWAQLCEEDARLIESRQLGSLFEYTYISSIVHSQKDGKNRRFTLNRQTLERMLW